ncbi:uncharacterized protein LOC123703704 [Colias croceus]|uniref:uncharacterized protein LOC123703704 n=1 Tax=Colias crocea TaxID=72248 RepID=UPI001E27DB15|nr:uncharacterized protein LOC123703704 [Colias croceus]
MKLKIFAALLLLGLAHAAPTTYNYCIIVKKEQFPENLVKYTGEHDIVKIVVPVNSLNFDDFDSIVKKAIHFNPKVAGNLTLFFIEADVDESGKLNYQGLYVLKNNKAKKILENGRDAAASVGDNTSSVFLAASDGLYLYNDEDQSAQKYGSITDNIIAIDKESETDVLYILTEDKTVYRVTDNGNKKEKLEDVKNAQQLVIDSQNNLYFYTTDKKLYVRTSEGVKQVTGLPEEHSSLVLAKYLVGLDDFLPILVDYKFYSVYANGTFSTSPQVEFTTDFQPTAFTLEGTIVQYYGYNKKIYEINQLPYTVGKCWY